MLEGFFATILFAFATILGGAVIVALAWAPIDEPDENCIRALAGSDGE